MACRPLRGEDPQTYTIIGVAMDVHGHLGHGFLEAVYREAMLSELEHLGIPFRAEVKLSVTFKGRLLATGYRADLVCFDQVIVELKALRSIGGAEEAQVLNYLKASGLTRRLLLNFGAPSLEYRRFIRSTPQPP